MQGQMAAQNGRPANMRPGDWMCPSCNNHNYADKVRCNRCKMPKPDTFDPFAMRQAKPRPLQQSWGWGWRVGVPCLGWPRSPSAACGDAITTAAWGGGGGGG